MANNITVKNATAVDTVLKTTDDAGVHTPHHIVDSIAVPINAPLMGQVKIAVTGTAVPLSATSAPLVGGSVQIRAKTGNNVAHGTVGDSTVTNTVDGTGNGYILEAGDIVVAIASDLADVYVNGTANDVFSYSAG
jgi:hypothetical protein